MKNIEKYAQQCRDNMNNKIRETNETFPCGRNVNIWEDCNDCSDISSCDNKDKYIEWLEKKLDECYKKGKG